ncbi:MAG: hypothetical protein QF464_12840, partial [Myxococcota bacterium]|nr:hypothetical protein [Myxococcota bacterium]
PLHFESKVLDTWATEMGSADVRAYYYFDLAVQGCEAVEAAPVTAAAAKRARVALRAATHEAIDEKVLSAASADLLDDDEASDLRKLEGQQRTEIQDAELVRHGVLNFWGRTDEQLVKDWVKGGKRRRAATEFVFAAIVRQGGPALGALRAQERTWVAEMGGFYRAHLRHKEQKAEVVDAIMRLAGLDPALVDASLAPTPIPLVNGYVLYDWNIGSFNVMDFPPPGPNPAAQLWSKQSLSACGFQAGICELGKRYPLRELLGAVAKDAPRNPVRFLNGVLRLRGLNPKRRRPRSNEYWLNPEEMVAWAEDCRRHFSWAASSACREWRPCAARTLEPTLFVDTTVFGLLDEGSQLPNIEGPNRVTALPPIPIAVDVADQEEMARFLNEILSDDARCASRDSARTAAPCSSPSLPAS